MLRLLPGIGQIYLLIRDKMKQTAEERLKQLLESRLFAFHPHASDQLCKVIILRGDVSQPMFGMTKDQWTPLLSEVHILFHLAASVKFNASFR